MASTECVNPTVEQRLTMTVDTKETYRIIILPRVLRNYVLQVGLPTSKKVYKGLIICGGYLFVLWHRS